MPSRSERASRTWSMLQALAYFPAQPLHRLNRTGARFTTGDASIALTFDDGPHPRRTPAVLDCLRTAGIRATFFVVGSKAAAWPRCVRRIVEEGHLLGHHAWSHRFLPALPERALFAELDRTSALLQTLTGRAPTLIRPPYGWGDRRFFEAAARRGLTPVLWSLDTFDYLRLSAAAVHRRLRRAVSGDIVLLHDGNEAAHGTLPALEAYLGSVDTAAAGRSHEALRAEVSP